MVVDPAAPWAELVLYTADDLAAMPEELWHYELVDGRRFRTPPVGAAQGCVNASLGALLYAFVDSHGLGSVLTGDSGFIPSRPGEPDTVLAPDVAFISTATMTPEAVRRETRYPRLAPELVAEIAPPTQHRPGLAAKAQRWLRSGVKLAWVIWPAERELDVWDALNPGASRTLTVDSELDGREVLRGFKAPVSDLWS